MRDDPAERPGRAVNGLLAWTLLAAVVLAGVVVGAASTVEPTVDRPVDRYGYTPVQIQNFYGVSPGDRCWEAQSGTASSDDLAAVWECVEEDSGVDIDGDGEIGG